MDSAMVKLSNALDLITLPDGAGKPMIMEVSMDMMPVIYASVDYEGKDIYELSDFVENTVNITGILSEQTALEHESIGFAGSIPYLAVTNQSLISHQFENRTAFRRTVNIDETHIRNTQCARVNRNLCFSRHGIQTFL